MIFFTRQGFAAAALLRAAGVAAISLLAAGTAGAEERADAREDGDFLGRAEAAVASFEREWSSRFVGDPGGAPLDSLNLSIREYNAWNLAEGDRLDAERKALEEERIALALPNREDDEAAAAHRARLERYNEGARDFSARSAARQAELDARRAALEARIEEQRLWREGGGAEKYWAELNRFFANLHEERRRSGDPERFDGCVERTRAIRAALGARAARIESAKENGLLVVPARLGGEEGWFLVDTGASLLSLSPELVDALGWTHLLGDTLESAVAGGLIAVGRELIVPQITVLGVTAKNVRAKALVETHPGVDGLLGRSFLSRFRLIVDDRAEQRVRLERR
ncbi:MAG: clan AA aspartic protease [Candidatus Eisenbacteria bacterium]|nr:clan AA aspartic protease [Candidatus Eisenbacteria bacterium]